MSFRNLMEEIDGILGEIAVDNQGEPEELPDLAEVMEEEWEEEWESVGGPGGTWLIFARPS